jgi:hypothetical protein
MEPEPLTIDDMKAVIGEQQVIILQLNRHIQRLEAELASVRISSDVAADADLHPVDHETKGVYEADRAS